MLNNNTNQKEITKLMKIDIDYQKEENLQKILAIKEKIEKCPNISALNYNEEEWLCMIFRDVGDLANKYLLYKKNQENKEIVSSLCYLWISVLGYINFEQKECAHNGSDFDIVTAFWALGPDYVDIKCKYIWKYNALPYAFARLCSHTNEDILTWLIIVTYALHFTIDDVYQQLVCELPHTQGHGVLQLNIV